VQQGGVQGMVAAVTTTRTATRFSLHLPLLAGRWRLLGVVTGCVIAAGGIAATLQAGLGVGPYDVLNSGVSGQLGISFGTANVLASVTACLVGWRLGGKIGPGTIVATLAIGPFVDLWRLVIPEVSALPIQIGLLLAGLVVLSFGLSLIIASGLGAGAIEVLMLGIVNLGVPLRWARTVLEIGMCIAGVALGGQFGPGTILIALAIGHVMAMFVPREVA
jgi:uncharacterized membrane protein YczE